MKFKIAYILLLLSAVSVYGQVTLAVSEVRETRVNQRFNLTVILEINGENMIQETRLRMPDLSRFDIVGSASEQNTIVLDAGKGEVLNQVLYQLALIPKQAGKVKFGSVLVTVNGKIYKTEPFEINVREAERPASSQDYAIRDEVYLNMEVEDRNIYKNQPTRAVLRAYSRDYGNFRKVRNIQYPKQKNIRIEPVSYAKSEIESRSGLASQILAIFLIFPNEAGNIEINPVTATVAGPDTEKINSNKVRLHVKKLPSGKPAGYTNAVGTFDVNVTKTDPETNPEIDKPVNVTVKISGSGNLKTISLPKMIDSENYTFYKPKVAASTKVSEEGLAGSVSAEYIVVPKKAGIFPITFEKFSFFNPDEKKYVDLSIQPLILDVKTHEQIIDSKSTLERVNDYTNNVLETVNTPVLQTQNLKIKNKDEINWKIVVGNLALLVTMLSVVFMVRKKMGVRKNAPVVADKPITTIAETEEMIRKDFQVQFDDNIKYLKNLAENKDFTKFFTAYSDLHSDTKKWLNVDTESDFKKFLEQHKGQIVAEDYRTLAEKIKIEKYSPYHSDENMDRLLESILQLYSEIRR